MKVNKIFLLAVMGCFALPVFAEDNNKEAVKAEEVKAEDVKAEKPAKKSKKAKKAKHAKKAAVKAEEKAAAPALPTEPSVPAVAPTAAASSTPEGYIKVSDNTFVAIHGMVNASFTYDMNGYGGDELGAGGIFSTETDNKQKLSMHAKSSRLNFSFLNKSNIGDIKAFTEVDFAGDTSSAAEVDSHRNAYAIRLRHAYVTVNGFLIGHTDSLFLDFDQITTVDTVGHFGGGQRQFQVRYAYDFGMANVAVALERATADFRSEDGTFTGSRSLVDDNGDSIGLVRQTNLPDLTAKVGFKFGDSNVGLRTIVRKVSVKDVTNADKPTYSKIGYGIGLNAKIATMKNCGFVAAVNYGKGIGRYLSEFEGTSVLINRAGKKAELVKFMEWGLGYTQALGENFAFNIGYSETNAKTDALAQAEKRTTLGKIQRSFVNVIWSPVKELSVGLEYAEVRTRAMDTSVAAGAVNPAPTKGKRNRVLVGVQYNF